MRDSKLTKYFLVGISLIFLYLAFIIVRPFIQTVILSFVFAFAFYPLYSFFKRKLNSENLSASIMLVLILLLIIIPGFFVVNSLLNQAYSTYNFVQNADFEKVNQMLPEFLQFEVDLSKYANDLMRPLRDYIARNTSQIIGSIASITVSLFIFFFILFYAFRDGKSWVEKIQKNYFMKQEYTEGLIESTGSITSGVIYGYLLTALIQGTLGGILLVIFNVPNAIFWTFIMIVLSSIPILGTPIIWIPVGLLKLYNQEYFAGIFILLFGFIILMNVDNYLRPKLIGQKTSVHPGIILIGIVGGLSVFGFTGIILGPLFLTLFIVVAKFFAQEFRDHRKTKD